MKTIARLFAVSGLVLAAAMSLGVAFADPIPAPEPISPVVQIDGNCTGFHIGGGRIVTAGHCISKMSGFKVLLSDGREVGASLVMYSEPRRGDDMALLRVSVGGIESLGLSCGAPPAVGTEIHMTGYPGGFGLSTVWGRVASAPRDYTPIGGWRDAIPINISSFGGFSGSPVMTADDKVIGILTGSLVENKNLAMAVPAYRLCEFIGHAWLV